MTLRSFQDLKPQQVLGRKRIHVKKIIGVPLNESIDYRIHQLRKELGNTTYQLFFLGEWKTISYSDYREYLQQGLNVRVI